MILKFKVQALDMDNIGRNKRLYTYGTFIKAMKRYKGITKYNKRVNNRNKLYQKRKRLGLI